MGLLDPAPTPYDPVEWAAKPFQEKAQMVCRAWAMQGYGTPFAGFALYAFKVVLYIGAWIGFCSFTPGLGGLGSMDWWLHPVAFQKAIIWSMAFEVLGLGCGSGPLTGRYFPPVGGFLYFLRPGTTKMPLLEGVPVVGGRRRTVLDVALYAALLGCLGWALVDPAPGFKQWLPIAVLVPLLGVLDKTIFLAARGEHYWVTVVCFAFAGNWIAGAKAVQVALWFGAGFSKLNHHFPSVVCVMTSNSPFTRFEWLRRRMYRHYPDDLRPSRVAEVMAHMGTALELSVPLVLLAGSGGTVTTVGLVLMLMLHVYITSNVPMGVPIEWNFAVVYGAFFLFSTNAAVSVTEVSPPIAVFLFVMLVVVPLVGNFAPHLVSFLLSMRYYAGNWACSVWLFRGESYRKLDQHLVKTAPWIFDQLDHFYDRKTAIGMVGKVISFRLMHLHGRAVQELVPRAVERLEDYEWVDGELVAGLVLGWNFGDGHLHSEQLLRSVQAQCGFEPGELRCVFIEAQPFGRSTLAYRIHDASTGLIEAGKLSVKRLCELQPWPESSSASPPMRVG
ncbi:DUF3556 domain-containing protein [Hyalangium versicolor]|uniref:DUF3556 domain-containing protein n=1 Tax=Hyalangium versicolor TaxID=2861190 RepID=UPI001CCC8D27|nr:DUF3556 domain-containing protein [Hyalangium versicolor]